MGLDSDLTFLINPFVIN